VLYFQGRHQWALQVAQGNKLEFFIYAEGTVRSWIYRPRHLLPVIP